MIDHENTRWYKFNPGCYCGVLMPEDVMKKLVKLNAKYSEEVRKVLYENKGNLIPYEWTMASKKDDQGCIKNSLMITYSHKDSEDRVMGRLRLFKVEDPEYVDKVYFVDDYLEADALAEQLLNEKLADESN